MGQVTHQCVGIDCAKDDFAVTFAIRKADLEIQFISSRKFSNDASGFNGLLQWVQRFASASGNLIFVMEATGVYHELLACFLYDSAVRVAVVLPQRAKAFSKTLKTKTVTDKEASRSLAVMGLEKKLDLWQKPEPVYRGLKQLVREKNQLQDQIVEVRNQVHAELSGAWPNHQSVSRAQERLQLLQKQLQAIAQDIDQVLTQSPGLKRKIKRIATAPGVGELTVISIVAETHGFAQIRNKRQLVSYAGYDVVEKQSGTSVHGRARISKRGNHRIRRALHMPALAAIRSNPASKETFKRIVAKSGIKMKGVVAIQRKLLVLIYTLWKNDAVYDPHYEEKKAEAARCRP